MAGPIWRRPSAYVVLCATSVIAFFVARGDLRVEPGGGRREASSTPVVVHNRLPAPDREVERVVLAGRVFDALGRPIAGAVVTSDGETAHSGEDGRFSLTVVDGPFVDLTIEARRCMTRRLRASPEAPDPLVVHLEAAAPWDPVAIARLPEPVLTGEGTVRDREGHPIVGAFVTAAGSGLWSRTDDIGRYSLPLPGPSATIVVHRPASGSEPGVAARSEPLTFERSHGLVPLPELIAEVGASLRGILRDERDVPLRGVPVAVEGEGVRRVFETGEDGVFACSGLLAGVYRVTPLAWFGALATSREVVVDGDGSSCEFRLAAASSLEVRVCDEKGSAVDDAYVASILAGRRCCVDRTDADGRATVWMLPGVDDYEVRAGGSGARLDVRRFDRDGERLVVAAP